MAPILKINVQQKLTYIYTHTSEVHYGTMTLLKIPIPVAAYICKMPRPALESRKAEILNFT